MRLALQMGIPGAAILLEFPAAMKINAFTVDVEDGISIAMRDRFGLQVPQTTRVSNLTHKLLEALARHGASATFFVLGQVGERFPELVREIDDAGHEVGVHGCDHLVFHELSRKQAWQELSRAKGLLEDLTGTEVRGHRAPCFSIDGDTAWALDLLLELGFRYDSSIMPGHGIGYGWPGQSFDIGPVKTPEGAEILEVPLSVISFLGRQVPALGGSYFRLLPFMVSRRIFQSVQRNRPVIVYLHPYELDPERYPDDYMKALAKAPLRTRVRMRSFWLRRESLLARYERLLSEFRFVSIRNLLAHEGFSNV